MLNSIKYKHKEQLPPPKGRLAKSKRGIELDQNGQSPKADNGTPRDGYANGPGQITIRLGPSQNKIL